MKIIIEEHDIQKIGAEVISQLLKAIANDITKNNPASDDKAGTKAERRMSSEEMRNAILDFCDANPDRSQIIVSLCELMGYKSIADMSEKDLSLIMEIEEIKQEV